MKRTIKICPRNAPLFGEAPATEEQSTSWCHECLDPEWCDGCERYPVKSAEKKRQSSVEQKRLF